MNKENKLAIKKYKQELKEREIAAKKLIEPIDYIYLQKLIDKAQNNDVVITIFTRDGNKVVIEKKWDSAISQPVFNGVPGIDEG